MWEGLGRRRARFEAQGLIGMSAVQGGALVVVGGGQGCIRRGRGGGCLGVKSLCNKNGPTRFSLM